MKQLYSFFSPENKWKVIAFIAVIKIALFAFFAFELHHQWSDDLRAGSWAVATGDSKGYYAPSDNFVTNGVYNSNCRMPGVLPLYAPLAWVFGTTNAKDAVTILQLLVSIISVYVLGLIALQWTKNNWAFLFTILIYSVSSFVSIWDNFLMADSFSTSFFIFSVYFLWKGLKADHKWSVVLSGAFLVWAVFFRQIFLIVYPMVAIIMLVEKRKEFRQLVLHGVAFILPLIAAIGLWMNYQSRHLDETAILAAPVENCYSTYTPQYQKIYGLLLHMGYGEPFWDKGTVSRWMLNYNEKDKTPSIPDRHFNSAMNLDSLTQLRWEYEEFVQEKDPTIKDELGKAIITKVDRLDEVYKSENKISFYVFNRLRLFRLFILPMKIDNLPLPSLANMNVFEKIIKVFYLALFTVVCIFGLLSVIQTMMSARYAYRIWWIIPLSILLSLSVVLGYIEQRYFVPVYPFLTLALAIFVARFFKGKATTLN